MPHQSTVDALEQFLRERRERLGQEEVDRQRELRHCDGSRWRYAIQAGFKHNDS
jgi:hypothetical protein